MKIARLLSNSWFVAINKNNVASTINSKGESVFEALEILRVPAASESGGDDDNKKEEDKNDDITPNLITGVVDLGYAYQENTNVLLKGEGVVPPRSEYKENFNAKTTKIAINRLKGQIASIGKVIGGLKRIFSWEDKMYVICEGCEEAKKRLGAERRCF